jgi:hypothetical protein
VDLSIDINELTIDDVVDLEEAVGRPIQDILGDRSTAPQGKTLKALIWVVKRKTEPGFTLEDAGKISFVELSKVEVEVEDMDPTAAAGSTSS